MKIIQKMKKAIKDIFYIKLCFRLITGIKSKI